ncbi:MAG: GNAT family N-acetyltransferase [Candidatus Methanoliparum thermophilum]|uniref:GNAT family N-acetyltransferase n=1 Tax=Methanoliparum thermophilum TaxID=2491083 RepID=A0A520KRE5_METT2|nr:MAG: GNAT family N-acetyltransferase [Candidatus Methanoliparum thermophilum]
MKIKEFLANRYFIREADEKDSMKIEALAKKASPLRPSVAGTYEYLALCFKRYFLVAIDEDILGFIIGLPNIDNKNESWIYQIAVHPSYRRKKIASNLLKMEIERLTDDNFKKIKARILSTNNRSFKFFNKYGFNMVGYIDNWIEVEKEL